jgi:hypothetical protein
MYLGTAIIALLVNFNVIGHIFGRAIILRILGEK